MKPTKNMKKRSALAATLLNWFGPNSDAKELKEQNRRVEAKRRTQKLRLKAILKD